MRVIAIIPARGGSKRLPRKNILPVNGHPMISYPIQAAFKSGLFDDVIVSTEDAEIAEIAKSYKATISHRPSNLAQDRSTVVQVCADLLSRKKYHSVDIFCCIYATAIFLSPNDLIQSKKLLTQEPVADFIMGVSQYNYPPVQAMQAKSGYLCRMWPEYNSIQSQFYPHLLVSNGTLYWARKKAFLQDLTFYGEKLKGYLIVNDHTVDINTVDDYEQTKMVAEERGKNLWMS